MSDIGYKTREFELRNLLLYLLIAFGWSWLWWLLFTVGILKMPAGIGTPEVNIVSAGPIVILIALTPFGPTIGSFVVTYMTEGKTGVKKLWKRFWSTNLGLRWFLGILLILVILFGTPYLLTRIFEGIKSELVWMRNPLVIIGLIIANLINGGLSEEFGWRGYTLPRLQARWDALTSSIILGVIWAVWHFPLWFMLHGPRLLSHTLPSSGFIILTSVLFTWVFNNTNGSILGAVLFHALGSVFSEMLPSNFTYAFSIRLVLVVLIVILYGSKNLTEKNTSWFKL
jgi:membrane protease YdiL (CAAX protease family)